MEERKESAGLGAGLGVKVDLRLGQLKSAVDDLTEALRKTGDTATGLISDAVRKLREAGVQKLKEASEKEGGRGEATEAYDRTVKELQSAADRGDAEARKLLSEMR